MHPIPFQQTQRYYQLRDAIKQCLCLPLLLPYLLLRQEPVKVLINADVSRWVEVTNYQGRSPLLYFLAINPEFRNLYNVRFKRANFLAFVASRVLKRFFPEEATLHIYTEEIGPGMYIQHGFSTIVAAQKIGKNFHVNQQVTIGFKGTSSPIVGDNVSVRAGALVIGDVVIGDDAVVGAGAVVTRDVLTRSTVVGVPANPLKKGKDEEPNGGATPDRQIHLGRGRVAAGT